MDGSRSPMSPTKLNQDANASGHGVSQREAFRVWLRNALLSFGGPAGQIAVMHRILVEEKRWISERRFLHALNYCMLLPGPEAQQLATYVGWLMHRTRGGIVAGGLFVVPGIVSIMALSYVYAGWGRVPIIQALFFGLKAAVLAIVLEAVVRIGRRALKNSVIIALASAADTAAATAKTRTPWSTACSETSCRSTRARRWPVRCAHRRCGSRSGSCPWSRSSSPWAPPTCSVRSRCSSARWRS